MPRIFIFLSRGLVAWKFYSLETIGIASMVAQLPSCQQYMFIFLRISSLGPSDAYMRR